MHPPIVLIQPFNGCHDSNHSWRQNIVCHVYCKGVALHKVAETFSIQKRTSKGQTWMLKLEAETVKDTTKDTRNDDSNFSGKP